MRTTRRNTIAAIFTIIMISFAAHADSDQVADNTSSRFFSGTQKGDYELGEKMLNCASFFKFASEIATKADMPSNAQQAVNKYHGWRMAAMLPLMLGLSDNKKVDAIKISDAIVDVKKTEYLGRIELSGPSEMSKINDEFTQNCLPLVPLQERIVNSMRSGN